MNSGEPCPKTGGKGEEIDGETVKEMVGIL